MKALQAWAEGLAARAVERAKARIVREIDLAGVTVAQTEQGVELIGRGLKRRVMTDARLRWIGRLFR